MLALGSLALGYAPTTVRPAVLNTQMGLLDAVKGVFGSKKQVSSSSTAKDAGDHQLFPTAGRPPDQRLPLY